MRKVGLERKVGHGVRKEYEKSGAGEKSGAWGKEGV